MWDLVKSEQYQRRYERYMKKKSNQLNAVLENLEVLLRYLRLGKHPQTLQCKFLHKEPSGVLAIDQSGGPKVAATRLYVYADRTTKTLYLLTLGDKTTQRDDIQDCVRYAKQIKEDPEIGREVAGEAQEDHEDGKDRDVQDRDGGQDG